MSAGSSLSGLPLAVSDDARGARRVAPETRRRAERVAAHCQTDQAEASQRAYHRIARRCASVSANGCDANRLAVNRVGDQPQRDQRPNAGHQLRTARAMRNAPMQNDPTPRPSGADTDQNRAEQRHAAAE